ncbi:alpha/beta superfamily hydrolase (macronuclear) [Tetrahymena thermophila SB210]|uniref:Alpha/beta superfamily hydrolase n=1 Tax=Tetrahymena thermophila (strain SB210) TaxID=312017 RepID=Q234E1_TETTS|nr:alpha/beta superfamily hydrolase [Tetrahymena thermophila SB210]EAR92062.3 alpha/beta superfamily hydrolase [Tetrahymena thermophila SB210]|eukprot:XP_001012307.3 alpha/beta superfamily hydrolase [Tetrahymena thermophila SB210]
MNLIFQIILRVLKIFCFDFSFLFLIKYKYSKSKKIHLFYKQTLKEFKQLAFIMDNQNLKTLVKAGVGGISLLGIGLLALRQFQEKLIYIPTFGGMPKSPKDNPFGDRTPRDMNLAYEDVSTVTKDNVTLRGWLIKQKDHMNKPTVVFFHENAGNIGLRLYYFQKYMKHTGVNILAFAYRGYSDSDDAPIDEPGLQKDSLAIIEYAFRSGKINPNNVFFHGRSLGGAVLTYGLTHSLENKPNGIILENTFTSLDDMVDVVFRPVSIFKRLILKNHWPTINQMSKVQVPALFIKSNKDELVPASQMQQLFDKCHSPNKHLYVIENGTHNDNWTLDILDYFKHVHEFINKYSNL